jgi:uncharacterized membrane protein
MIDFFRNRGISISTVVFVLLVIAVLQGGISYSTTFGRLDINDRLAGSFGLVLRVLAIAYVVSLWILNRKRNLFRAILIGNGLLTLGLIANMLVLIIVLTGFSSQAVYSLVLDVFLMAITNILIFSIWYWIIDPPGIEKDPHKDTPWDFLFPQRGSSIPHYESWVPRYTDYLYLAFTTSFAFSPTDTLPLTRRAKLLMLLQSTISLITLTGIAGAAINILAGKA